MYINIKGTFGSGKSTVVRGLIETLLANGSIEQPPIMDTYTDKDGKVKKFQMAHHFGPSKDLKRGLLILGRYGASQCGGADCLNHKGVHDVIEQFIYDKSKDFHILGEGSIMSGTSRYNKVGVNLRDKHQQNSWYGIMCQDLTTCTNRVMGRRNKKIAQQAEKLTAQGKPVPEAKPLDTTSQTDLFKRVKQYAQQAKDMGMTVELIDSVPASWQHIYQLMTEDDLRVL